MTPRGFSLIELMITLAVLAVLAALAYVNLSSYVVRARRVEAQVALLETMQEQERHFTRHHTYVAFSADNPDPDARRFRWHLGNQPAGSAYELQGQACAGQPITLCIELRAVPGSRRVNPDFRDAECGTLTMDSAGRLGAGGPGRKCWP